MSRAKEFLESIQERLFEFANPISKTEDKITDLGKPIIDHLIKILKWDDKIHNQKHCKDIDNWLNQVESCFKRSKRKPKSGKVYNWLYGEVESGIDSDIKFLTRRYGTLPQYRTDTELKECLKRIILEIDNQLQLKSEIESIIEICQKLEIEIKSCRNYWD